MNTIEVKNAIAKPITESVYAGEMDRTTILANVESYLIENRILFPSPEKRNRFVGEIHSKIVGEKKEKAQKNVLDILSTDRDTIVDGFLKEFKKYPPVFEGKPNLAKMAQEFKLKENIKKARLMKFVTNKVSDENAKNEILPINLIESDDKAVVEFIEELKENLSETWEKFNEFSKKHSEEVLMDGKLKDKRLQAKMSVEESERAKIANDSFLSTLPTTNNGEFNRCPNENTKQMG